MVEPVEQQVARGVVEEFSVQMEQLLAPMVPWHFFQILRLKMQQVVFRCLLRTWQELLALRSR